MVGMDEFKGKEFAFVSEWVLELTYPKLHSKSCDYLYYFSA